MKNKKQCACLNSTPYGLKSNGQSDQLVPYTCTTCMCTRKEIICLTRIVNTSFTLGQHTRKDVCYIKQIHVHASILTGKCN